MNEHNKEQQEAEDAVAEAAEQIPEEAEAAPAAAPESSGPIDDGLMDRFIRLQADFDNFRKRVQREKVEWADRANEQFIRELVVILDHFEHGFTSAEKFADAANVVQGFRLVYDQLLALLKRSGVEAFDAHDQDFDPHLHEAATHVPSNEHPEGRVISQIRRGYKMGPRLLRAAQVVVSSGGPEAPKENP